MKPHASHAAQAGITRVPASGAGACRRLRSRGIRVASSTPPKMPMSPRARSTVRSATSASAGGPTIPRASVFAVKSPTIIALMASSESRTATTPRNWKKATFGIWKVMGRSNR